jgi:hypothetical protein
MDIDIDVSNGRFIAEVWEPMHPNWEFREPYPEETYVLVNDWCIKTFGYHARTSYHVFEFKNNTDLTWFVLRWTGEEEDGN